MAFRPLNSTNSQATNNNEINNMVRQLNNEQKTKIYKDNNGVRNISIGVQPDGTSRIRIAKEGIDVVDATDDQLIFNSAQNVLKIVKTGTTTIPASGSTLASVTVTHSLGFSPGVMAYLVLDVDQYIPLNYSANGFSIYSLITPTTVRFLESSVSPITLPIDIKYYLLQETAN